jgi:hypothetical protein
MATESPDAVVLPETGAAINSGDRGSCRADPLPGDHVDFDARFLERAQGTGVVGAVRARAAKQQCRAAIGRVRFHYWASS